MLLSKLLAFSSLLTDFGKVERSTIRIPGLDRKENDVDHSYSLAMIAWYLIEANHLSLDTSLVLKYALVHDLVEVHAGDTYIYSEDESHLASKHERESAAADRLANDFPEFRELHDYIRAYEKRSDPESIFVYALDKLIPLFLIYKDDGRSWREHGVTLQMLVSHKQEKVALSPDVEPYFNDMIELLTREEGRVFGSKI